MRFDNTKDHLRLVYLQDNLRGDFTVGWNPIRSNTLGLRLVRESVDGLKQNRSWDNSGGYFPKASLCRSMKSTFCNRH